MTRRIKLPQYECPTCSKRLASVKRDGTLKKHGQCPSGLTPIDHGESWAPWVGQSTPTHDIPPCKRPPIPPDASRNERTLWLGDGWDQCYVLMVEENHGRQVGILVRDGDFIAVRSVDGSPVMLTDIEDDAVRATIARNEEYSADRAREQKLVAHTGIDWRNVAGDLRLVSVQRPRNVYKPKNSTPAYQRLWIAHMNLVDLILGETFTRTGSNVNIHRLLAVCGEGYREHYRARTGDTDAGRQALADWFLATFREEYFAGQSFERWWRKFYVRQAFGAFERLALRPMMSYGNARKVPGRSCVRVLAEHYLHPDGPPDLTDERANYNQAGLWSGDDHEPETQRYAWEL
jgi:hypothetical protein